ncbi:hypothetical protein HY029_04075, partial [Candidatus Gottesmanbacteria bacterium]|nr:hypothetical protein [Candidatus Gottesmanbacteria bacterium]
KCEKSIYHPSCFDVEIPKLMDSPTNLSMEESFAVTKIIQDKDTSYQYCHVLGHNLSAKETKKDPSKWKEVITRCPNGLCSNGCIHGSFQERFRSDSLPDEKIVQIKPDLMDVCEAKGDWHPTRLEQASCYHALGHLTMYMTKANIPISLNLCQEIAKRDDGRDYAKVCFDGVFMQIFQPLEPEDFSLVAGKQPKKDTLLSFCDEYKGIHRGSCISESWPLFFQELKDPSGVVKFCAMEELTEQDRCYDGIIYVMTAQQNFDEKKMSSYCAGLPQKRRGGCFGSVVSRFIETDYRNISKAVNFCKESLKFDTAGKCYDALVKQSSFDFNIGSSQLSELCNNLPEPWKSKCFGNK